MKLLFDQNLSPRLATMLADIYPDSIHISSVGLDRSLDEAVWASARQQNCAIVTKDVDFSELSALRGFPPKVIWLRMGNCTTAQIAAILRSHRDDIEALSANARLAVLTLF
jgi:predicted nuclease of predicted toxin-antitoxin system